MKSSPDHLRFLSLVNRFGVSDAELAAVLGVNRTTVWRLKSGKISKFNKYISALEKRIDSAKADTLERVLDDLITWSRYSLEVRTVLVSLHRALHEYATT